MKKNKEIILGRKDAVWGEIELSSDTQTIRQPMNTITQGFARFIGGVISGGGPLKSSNRVDGVATSALNEALYGLTSIESWSDSKSPEYKPLMIYFDYDPDPVAGYEHDKLFDDKFNYLSTELNDPQRWDFDHFNNANISVDWDERNKCIRITKSFKNITAESKYIRRIYLMCRGGFMNYSTYTAPTYKNLIIAMDEVAFEVLPDQQINISFIVKLDGFVNNGERWLRVLLGNSDALCSEDVFTYSSSSAYYRNLILPDGTTPNNLGKSNLSSLFQSSTNSSDNSMRIGYSNKPIEYTDHKLTDQADNTSYSSYFIDYLAYNEDEQCYDVKLSVVATNTGVVAQSYNEIGVFRVQYSTPSVLSHRAVLDETVVLQPEQAAEFSITFRCYCSHKETKKAEFTVDDPDTIDSIISSGNIVVGEMVTLHVTPKEGYVFERWVNTYSGDANVSTENNYQFIMPNADISYKAVIVPE